jgi:hypothetical protein
MQEELLSYTHPMLFRINSTRNSPGDFQLVYRFRNGYGASVIRNGSSYTSEREYELAVLRFNSEAEGDWDICYETHITNDVLGHLEPCHVRSVLDQVGDLPPDAKALPGAHLDGMVHNDSP